MDRLPHEAIVMGPTIGRLRNAVEIRNRYSQFVKEVFESYQEDSWNVPRLTDITNSYLNYTWLQKESQRISERSNYTSTVLEELFYYIFQPLAARMGLSIGKSECHYDVRVDDNGHIVDDIKGTKKKLMDVALYVRMEFGDKIINIPITGLEIKRYIDNTMFDSIWPIQERLEAFTGSRSVYMGVSELNALDTIHQPENIFCLRNVQRNSAHHSRQVGPAIQMASLKALIAHTEQCVTGNTWGCIYPTNLDGQRFEIPLVPIRSAQLSLFD